MPLLSALLIALSSYQSAPGAEFAALAAELQSEARERLVVAQSYPAQLAPAVTADDALYSGLNAFSAQAMRLSLAMERRNGPEDLRCIFRGMAQDALLRQQALNAAEIRADRIQVFTDLEYLLQHAAEIGPIADQEEIDPFTGVDPGCPRGPLR
ncbi:hypothetical protein [Hyphobacterium sp.]|uniref:hypothetical protein n=1 Tax=Hyphobacterium sp. TaxID=2004662 RepID=UPI00374795B1